MKEPLSIEIHNRGGFVTKKYLGLTILSLAAILIALYLSSYIPAQIDLQYPAIQYRRSQPREIENTYIKIQGKLYQVLFQEPKFVGKIMINSYQLTSKYGLIPPVFYKKFNHGASPLVYETVIDGTPKLELLGYLRISDHFRTLSISVTKPTRTRNQSLPDLFISAPATNREEAIKITESLSPKESQP